MMKRLTFDHFMRMAMRRSAALFFPLFLIACVGPSEEYYAPVEVAGRPLATLSDAAHRGRLTSAEMRLDVVSVDGKRYRPNGDLFPKPELKTIEPGTHRLQVFGSQRESSDNLFVRSAYLVGEGQLTATFSPGKAYRLAYEKTPGALTIWVWIEEVGAPSDKPEKFVVQLHRSYPSTTIMLPVK